MKNIKLYMKLNDELRGKLVSAIIAIPPKNRVIITWETDECITVSENDYPMVRDILTSLRIMFDTISDTSYEIISTDKQANERYWDKINILTEQYIAELIARGFYKQGTQLPDFDENDLFQVSEEIAAFTTKFLKNQHDLEFPYVN